MSGVMNTMTKLQQAIAQGPPPGYIPGKGRGAHGFMTRGDLGPVTGRGPVAGSTSKPEVQEMNDAKYDPFSGYNQSLVRSIDVTEEDQEAEKLYDTVDKHMEEGGRKRKAAGGDGNTQPTAREITADLKPDLANISVSQWESLPDPVSLRQKRRKKDDAPSSRVPDSVILSSIRNEGHDVAISGAATAVGGTSTEFRAGALSMLLDAENVTVSGKAEGSRAGILSGLATATAQAESFADVKQSLLTAKNRLKSNPHHIPSWLILCRAERQGGNTQAAKKAIQDACANVPKSEEIWIEALSLSTKESEEARLLAAQATHNVPKSVKLWVARAKQETDPEKKAAILQDGLELLPDAEQLWVQYVDLQESAADAKELLQAAVENAPTSVNMWLAYVKLETKLSAAQRILNKAVQSNPTDRRIRVAAGQLQEAHGDLQKMETVIYASVPELSPAYVSRSEWFDEAIQCERVGSPATAKAIVFAATDLDVQVADTAAREFTYVSDAQKWIAQKQIAIARYVYAYALQQFPDNEAMWELSAELEETHGTKESYDALLREGMKHCANSRKLWLMLTKSKWKAGDVDAARAVLAQAFAALPHDALVRVAAAKLEAETGNLPAAAALLEQARKDITTPDAAVLWMKSAKLARQLGKNDEQRALLDEGIRKHPKDAKLWLMRLQLDAQLGIVNNNYVAAIKAASSSPHIWMLASSLQERAKKATIARTLLEKARNHLKCNEDLWLASIRLEVRDKNPDTATRLLSQALQACPKSGLLWNEAIAMEPTGPRKAKATDALTKVPKDGLVCCAMARVLWSLRDLDRARKFFQRAVKYGPEIGDVWAYYYRFEVQDGTPQTVAAVASGCVRASPHLGEHWIKVTKDPQNVTLGGCKLTTEQVLEQVAMGLAEYDE